MAMEACKAAYTKGGPWLEAVKSYIYENYLYVEAYLKANLPQITCTPLEGTYLLWIDFSALGFESDRALDDFVTTEAKLWLNSGSSFGTGGENHMRLNIACPRSVLNQALTQLKDAVQRRL
jgi:cystathionine beta-lyase